MDPECVWRDVVGHLRERLSAGELACWIETLQPVSFVDGVLAVDAPSRLHVDQLRRFASEVRQALDEVCGRPIELRASVRVESSARPALRRAPQRTARFDRRYTFEHFVPGRGNEIAYRGARAIVDAPARAYNPLFLHGGVGLGKTHLVTAAGNALSVSSSSYRVAVYAAETFANEWIAAFRSNALETFRGAVRRCDVLIVDDVQFFAGKERMQEEFFHTFNALIAAGKQIVLASDKAPNAIPNLEERLRSRFQSGLIAEIFVPETPLRLAILAKKACLLGFQIPSDVAQMIAAKFVSSVRELEGALQRLVAACSASGCAPDLAFATQVLRPLFRVEPFHTVEQVQRLVAERFRVSCDDLTCRSRLTRVRVPRQIAMYLARTGTSATYVEIAAGFGGRDHTTVMHAVRSVEERRRQEPEFAAVLESLADALRSS